MVTNNAINSPDPADVSSGGTGLSSTTAYAVLCGGTTSTAALQSIASVGTAGQVLTSNGAGALPTYQAVGGGTSLVVQRVSTQTGAVATGTTVLPADDTIPQITEGDEYMTRAITPLNSAHILVITVTIAIMNNTTGGVMAAALFQDATANALAVGTASYGAASGYALCYTHVMTAGTTSSTTFRVRAGNTFGAITTTFNGSGSARLFGGVLASSITIVEYTT